MLSGFKTASRPAFETKGLPESEEAFPSSALSKLRAAFPPGGCSHFLQDRQSRDGTVALTSVAVTLLSAVSSLTPFPVRWPVSKVFVWLRWKMHISPAQNVRRRQAPIKSRQGFKASHHSSSGNGIFFFNSCLKLAQLKPPWGQGAASMGQAQRVFHRRNFFFKVEKTGAGAQILLNWQGGLTPEFKAWFHSFIL